MKLITAIIKPEKLDELIGVITDNGARGMTVTDVRGFAGSTVSLPPAGRTVKRPA